MKDLIIFPIQCTQESAVHIPFNLAGKDSLLIRRATHLWRGERCSISMQEGSFQVSPYLVWINSLYIKHKAKSKPSEFNLMCLHAGTFSFLLSTAWCHNNHYHVLSWFILSKIHLWTPFYVLTLYIWITAKEGLIRYNTSNERLSIMFWHSTL